MERKQEGRKQGERGDTPLIGIILLFGFVFAGAAVVAFTGMMAIDAIEDRSVGERNLQAMQQFDADISSMQYAGEDERVPLVFESGDTEIANHGSLTFTINGECSYEQDLNALVHEDDGTELHYQVGGIFKPGDGGSELVSSPNFDYRQETVGGETIRTMDFPLVSLEESENASVGDTKTASFDEERTSEEQQRMMEELCLADGDTIVRNVTITLSDNPHQDAWKRYFEDVEDAHPEADIVIEDEETELHVTAPLGPDEVLIQPEYFTAPERWMANYGSLVATADNVVLNNVDTVDGYDSSEGAYDESDRIRGDVFVYDGVLDLHHVDDFYSHAWVDGTITGHQSSIDGGAYYTGDLEIDATYSDSEWSGLDESEVPPDISDVIAENVSLIEEYHHNDDTAAIEDGAIGFDSNTATLDAGIYYLDELDVGNGEELVVDVTDGDVVIAVDGDVSVHQGKITVDNEGNTGNEVRWFVTGDSIDLHQGSWAVKENDRSTQNWVLGTSSTDTEIHQSEFTGVLYTPSADVDVNTGSTIKGGLVGDVHGSNPGTSFHYDGALERFQTGGERTEDVDYGNITDGGTTVIGGTDGSNVAALDWEVTLVDSELAVAEFPTDSVDITDMPIETVDDFDGELEYWQRASSTTDEEKITFEANEPDVIAVEVDADGVDPTVEVIHDSSGDTLATASGSGLVSVEDVDVREGEHTIRVSAHGEKPFKYDVTLEKTRIEDVEFFHQVPIESQIVFDGMDDVQPWPTTDLDASSTSTPMTEYDVNHPANQYPKTHAMDEAPTDVGISIGAKYATQACAFEYDWWGNPTGLDPGADIVYAGTSRTMTVDGEEMTLYEVTCGEDSPVNLDSINAIEDQDSERIRILQDGDEVPDIEPAAGQRGLQDMIEDNEQLEGSLVENGSALELRLDDNEFVALFELGSQQLLDENCPSGEYWECALDEDIPPIPDFNNKVAFFEVTGVHWAAEYEIEVVDTVNKGDEVEFEVRLNNTVDDEVGLPVGLEFGHVDEAKDVELDPHEEKTVTFTLTGEDTDELDLGIHEWTVTIGETEIRDELRVVPEGATIEEGERTEIDHGTDLPDYSYSLDIDAGVIVVESG